MSFLTSSSALSILLLLLISSVQNAASSIDYKTALKKSLLYYEAQRSGKLPSSQRVQWRGHSALNDGKDIGVDLVGGYYDAGDNVKFGFPMAFTMTMLAWSVIEFRPKLQARGELTNALTALRWGADYLVKAHPEPNVLYAQVGDGNSDHSCWERPEDMTTPRTVYKIDERSPGSDLAGETAAALAAASIAFKGARDSRYSSKLLVHAKQLFDFATKNTGLYQNSVPGVGQFYSSSGYMDELLWAASWLARASKDRKYADYINQLSDSGGTRTMFSWDDKYVGAQVLVTKGFLEGKLQGNPNLYQYKYNAEQYICNCIQNGTSNVPKTSGGLLWFSEWNNLQYVTTASFIASVYADILSATKSTMQCKDIIVRPDDLIGFARSQVDYILGSNPKKMSYMVGYGSSYPKRVHHRGASIVSIKKDPTPVTCQGGFDKWFHVSGDNPNVLEGAIVGGPNQNDAYDDARENYQQAESATVNTAPLVGVLARLAR